MIKSIFLWLKNVKTKLRFWFWVLLVGALLVGGFMVFGKKPKTEVFTAEVEQGTIRQELVLTGSVNADKYAKLSFATSGKIAWVNVKEGQEVKKGQALTGLDTTTLNVTYQDAINTYRKYQATAENILDQVKDHSGDETYVQKDTRTTAEVNRDNAYDAVTSAKYNLDNAQLYAPFAGIISSLPFTSPGVNVSSLDTQVEIVDPSTIYFDVDADQNDVTNVNVGQEVRIVLDPYQDKEIMGKVTFISYTPKAGESN